MTGRSAALAVHGIVTALCAVPFRQPFIEVFHEAAHAVFRERHVDAAHGVMRNGFERVRREKAAQRLQVVVPVVGNLLPRNGLSADMRKAFDAYNNWLQQYVASLDNVYMVDFFNA